MGVKQSVDAILEHPFIKAVSFVGSTPVAKYIYQGRVSHGKTGSGSLEALRTLLWLCLMLIEEATVKILADSAFGCAGQTLSGCFEWFDCRKGRGNFTRIISAAKTKETRETG